MSPIQKLVTSFDHILRKKNKLLKKMPIVEIGSF